MKRAAEDAPSGGDAKKGTMNVINEKVDPIPRNLKLQSVTLHFTQRTWEELGPGELKYLPLCTTPYYMMDSAMYRQLKNFQDLWCTMEIHKPHARLTNLIMLQDDLVNQGGTPMETTAFTQVCYMLKYQPDKMTQYFQLADIQNCITGDYSVLTHNLNSVVCGDDYSQLIKLGSYKDFERLAILPAKIDKFAGYDFQKEVKPTKVGEDSFINQTYISPRINYNEFGLFACDLQPQAPPVIPPLNQITWARNLDNISLHKVGDVVDIPITTNLDGVPLLNSYYNDFLNSRETTIVTSEGDVMNYDVEFMWPGNNRPYYDRKTNLNDIQTNLETKEFKPLSHTFLTMPPIRKANGALLKQRCSFFLEQSFSVTINFPETVWGRDSSREFILDQKDAVMIRPGIYGHTSSDIKNEGAICPNGDIICEGDTCPFDNSFQSLIDIFVQYSFDFSFTTTIPKSALHKYTYDEVTRPWGNEAMKEEAWRVTWKTWLLEVNSGKNDYLYIDTLDPKPMIILKSRAGSNLVQEAYSQGNPVIVVEPGNFRAMLSALKLRCPKTSSEQPMKATYRSTGRDCTLFYV